MEVGKSVELLREQRGLTQRQVAEYCGLTVSFIDMVEHDKTSPSIKQLGDIQEALGADIISFFAARKDDKIVFKEEDTCTDETEQVKTRWLVPNGSRRRTDPMIIELVSNGATEWNEPGDGEVFGYVLMGIVQLDIGARREKVHRGESFSFVADQPYRFANVGVGRAKTLVLRAKNG